MSIVTKLEQCAQPCNLVRACVIGEHDDQEETEAYDADHDDADIMMTIMITRKDYADDVDDYDETDRKRSRWITTKLRRIMMMMD